MNEKYSCFLNDLTELCNKHGMGISEEAIVYEYEHGNGSDSDYDRRYFVNKDNKLIT